MASSERSALPDLPPLLRGLSAPPGADPLPIAARLASEGTDPGLIVHDLGDAHLRAALVLAPEVPLGQAITVLVAAMNGLADSLGALAPAETAVQFDWPCGIRINGGRCGSFRAAALRYSSTRERAQ